MNFTGVNRSYQRTHEDQPNWLSLSKYEAEAPASDKVSRLVNNFTFGAALYGAYTFATGGTGLLAYTSYLSLGLAMRKVASTTIGYLVYPAAFTSFPCSGSNYIAEHGKHEMQNLESESFIVKKISLYKSGTRYDAVLITHPDSIQNGNWTVNALGNGWLWNFLYPDLQKLILLPS